MQWPGTSCIELTDLEKTAVAAGTTVTNSIEGTGLCRSSRQQQEAEAVLAELQLATVAYCQQDLSQDEWTTIMQRMTQSAAALAVLLEDQVRFQLSCYLNVPSVS